MVEIIISWLILYLAPLNLSPCNQYLNTTIVWIKSKIITPKFCSIVVDMKKSNEIIIPVNPKYFAIELYNSIFFKLLNWISAK